MFYQFIMDSYEYIYLKAKKLNPIDFTFPKVSVTGTENLMMAATLIEGTTTLRNCAKEPEVLELANYLNNCGAKISGAGESEIIVQGVKKLEASRWNVLFDGLKLAHIWLQALLQMVM